MAPAVVRFFLATLTSCACPDPEAGSQVADLSNPASTPSLQRLTDPWWRNAVEDLLGVHYEGALPVDYLLSGFASVGATEVTVAPLDLEMYEAAAWDVAELAVPDATARDTLVGCALVPLLGEEDLGSDPVVCVEQFAARFASRAWRRSVDREELNDLVGVWESASPVDPTLAIQAVIATTLLSPDFLFRVTVGRIDPTDPSRRSLTDEEAATRLAFALSARLPNDVLLAAAAEGLLSDADGVENQATRIARAPEHAGVLTDWFGELVGLPELWLVDKDPALYPGFDDALRSAMIDEVRALFVDVALTEKRDLRDLFTEPSAHLTPELAALYGVVLGDDPTLPVDLPPERGGLLGRAAVATLHSHNTLTSPTLRGKFVRAYLLCQDIPPPPAGVIASLEALPTDGTLRDQLEAHRVDPACAPCHTLMDPLGYALENLDPIGAWRMTDRGFPIDSSGELDGVSFHGPDGLNEAVADHPDVPSCFVRNLFRHSLGRLETPIDDDAIDAATTAFLDAGGRFEDLSAAVARTAAFRTQPQPDNGPCDTEGATQACDTTCGTGREICVYGVWSGCTAPFPIRETCDNTDEDCDGAVDENVVMPCEMDAGWGVSTCYDGDWGTCIGANPGGETCNGLDDDADGDIDEDVAVDVTQVPHTTLSAAHGYCTADDPGSLSCRSATHRTCQANGCAASGIGAVASDGTTAAITCLDPAQSNPLAVTYGELAVQHGGCTSGTLFGADCNAAIHRWCAATGFVTGFGPVEVAGEDTTVVCTPSATVWNASYAVLATFHPTCDGGAQRAGAACDEAIHRWCRSVGHLSGFGPVENDGDLAIVSCVGAL